MSFWPKNWGDDVGYNRRKKVLPNHPVKTEPYQTTQMKLLFKATEEMVAFLAFIDFYIFGICIHEIYIGLFEPSIERLPKEPRENNEMHYLII